MPSSITLAADIQADRSALFQILSTTKGQQGFWTADCEVGHDRARFGFPEASADLITSVITEPDTLVRMHVLDGFPYWDGSTWEWRLGPAHRAKTGTCVLFRHYGLGDGYQDLDLGHTAQTWAMIMERLAGYAADGNPRPYFGTATTGN